MTSSRRPSLPRDASANTPAARARREQAAGKRIAAANKRMLACDHDFSVPHTGEVDGIATVWESCSKCGVWDTVRRA